MILKEALPDKDVLFFMLWSINNNNGIVMNPEKEIAFPISIKSKIIWFVGFKENWNTTKKTNEISITEIIFIKRSLNDVFCILNSLRNSIGINKINKEPKKSIKNQNNPCPFQAMIFCSTKPNDSKNK